MPKCNNVKLTVVALKDKKHRQNKTKNCKPDCWRTWPLLLSQSHRRPFSCPRVTTPASFIGRWTLSRPEQTHHHPSQPKPCQVPEGKKHLAVSSREFSVNIAFLKSWGWCLQEPPWGIPQFSGRIWFWTWFTYLTACRITWFVKLMWKG